MVKTDDSCSNCGRRLYPEDFGFLCLDCTSREAAIRAARRRALERKDGARK